MSFTFSTLLYWLLPLVALPVLIHLINLLRHRRVQWAAMEFLLESKKKNQNWIRLKQLLLLLARMAAVALIVFMLAGPMLQDQWSRLFGGGKTHHVILLDDSGSMTDHWSTTNAFARARQVVQNIVARAGSQASQHSFTFLRFSAAAAGEAPEIVRAPVSEEMTVQFERLHESMVATPLGVGPLAALETIETTVTPTEDENTVLYVVSDLRTHDWQDSKALKQALERLASADFQIQLVHCVERWRPNLAITHLAPAPGQQAVGVLIRMDVEITNHGDQPVANVPVQLQQTVYASTADEDGEIGALGAVQFQRIEPGESVTRSFDVTFGSPGSHEIRTTLPADALALDNQRYCVLEVAPAVPVLIVDDGGVDIALFMQLALAPPGVKTGVRVRIERSAFLQNNNLDRYHTIVLMNIETLTAGEIERLENYVRRGGGLLMFAGDKLRRDYANESMYRQGDGFFPLPLSSPTTLLVDRLEKAPDVQVQIDHPVFARTFAGALNTWLQTIVVERYFSVAKTWNSAEDPTVSVIASLRNSAPLIVERTFGEGRVIAVLTTAGPIWHNWGRNPTFAIWALDAQVYLGARKVDQEVHQVGEPLSLALNTADYQREVSFVVPAEPEEKVIQAHAQSTDDDVMGKTALDDVLHVGVYEARLTTIDGEPETRRFAYNAVESESDLRTVNRGELHVQLKGIPFEYRTADEFLVPVTQQAGFPVGEQWWFFLALVGLLVVEQCLAYSASYHPSSSPGGLRR